MLSGQTEVGFGWGIKGAAWATVIGQVVSGILVVVYFWKFRKMYLEKSMLKPRLHYLKVITALGLASCINQIAMALVQIVLFPLPVLVLFPR